MSFTEALRGLSSAQKPMKGTPAYSRYINRPVARYFAAAAYVSGRTPNQVSAVSGLFSLGAIVVLAVAPANWLTSIIVATSLVLGYMLDSADGQLARLRGGGSRYGEWLDHTLDCIKTASLHLAVLITFYRHFSLAHPAYLLVPVGYELVAVTTYFGLILISKMRPPKPQVVSTETSLGDRLRAIIILPTDYGFMCLAFYLLWAHTLFFIIYALLFAAGAAFLLLALLKWARELRAADAAGL